MRSAGVRPVPRRARPALSAVVATLAVLVTASCWGRCSPCYGFGPFLFLASTMAILAQVSACRALDRLNRRPA